MTDSGGVEEVKSRSNAKGRPVSIIKKDLVRMADQYGSTPAGYGAYPAYGQAPPAAAAPPPSYGGGGAYSGPPPAAGGYAGVPPPSGGGYGGGYGGSMGDPWKKGAGPMGYGGGYGY